MTPAEKAEELFNKMLDKAYEVDCLGGEYMVANRCALVAVDEIIEVLSKDINPLVNYWFEVKQEIEKL